MSIDVEAQKAFDKKIEEWRIKNKKDDLIFNLFIGVFILTFFIFAVVMGSIIPLILLGTFGFMYGLIRIMEAIF